MPQPIYETIVCRRCGHRWTVDLATLGKPETTIFRDGKKTRVETFRLVCPNSGTINMLEVTFEERRDA